MKQAHGTHNLSQGDVQGVRDVKIKWHKGHLPLLRTGNFEREVLILKKVLKVIVVIEIDAQIILPKVKSEGSKWKKQENVQASHSLKVRYLKVQSATIGQTEQCTNNLRHGKKLRFWPVFFLTILRPIYMNLKFINTAKKFCKRQG